jgi:hypothetical protein
VQPSRTRARNARLFGQAAGFNADGPGVGAVRSALEIAKERWGTPVGPVTSPPEPAGQRVVRPVRRDPLGALRIWSEPSPSMSAIWADLLEGARLQSAYGLGWLVPYWVFGAPGFAAACAARLLLDSSARPGRFAALLLAVLLFTAGLWVAGVI